jgi:hypothetical protein
MTRVEELWRDVAAPGAQHGVFRRVDENHPLDLYAGVDVEGRHVLMLVTHRSPPAIPSPGAVEVLCNQRGDCDWAVIFRLARPALDELFGRLCQDLVDNSRAATKDHGADIVLRRLSRWRKLLELGQQNTLSDRELRGLVGELWFLDTVAMPRVGIEAGVAGWNGPLGAPQDFLIDGLLVEVKTIPPGKHDVSISCVEQLDGGTTPLFLAVVQLVPADAAQPEAFTPSSLVQRLRATVEVSARASNEFELRLAEAGYTDAEEYARAWFRVTECRYYCVRDGFPRIVRDGLAAGVTAVSYEIDLQECGPFACRF